MTIRGFERSHAAPTAIPQLDESQARVLSLGDAESASVIGAPGSGKTTTLVELVADRVLNRGWSSDEVLVITPSRTSATQARDRLARRLAVPTLGPLARTATSLAFEIVRDAAAATGAEPPRLLTGAEQDQIIADLLEGESGEYWPEVLGPDVRRLAGFRTELRDLIMRATELGILPADLAALGRPEWTAAARFIAVYNEVTASYRERYFDSSELVVEAAAIVRTAPPASVQRLRLLVLDDAQEMTEATLSLVRAFGSRGTAIIAFGDPDISTGAFRGARPEVLGTMASALGVDGVRPLVLSTVHRSGGAIRALTNAITGRIGTAAAGTQRNAASSGDSTATGYLLTSRAEEVALIARRLRERHVLDGVPWSEMAVIVRTGVGSLARMLQSLEVQTAVSSARADARDEFAVQGIMLVVEVGLGLRQLDAEVATKLLLGPVGGLDSVGLRRLRAALRHEELAGGGDRSGDDLLAEALREPGGLVMIDTRVARAAARVADSVRFVTAEAAGASSIEELLWGVWQRSGLEKLWFDQALGSGLVAEEANRHLDAVVALFAAAKRFVERTPGAPAQQFVISWLGAELAEDSLAPRALVDAVTVATPSATIGQQFRVVIVAGVQENVWPNLRVRGSLLGANELAGTTAGADARAQVLSDELRLFAQAVSRASDEVVVTAVASDDTLPSPFLRLVPAGDAGALARHPLSLRGMAGQLRRELVGTGSAAAASALSRLAAEHVPGADPATWYGLSEPSTLEPLVDLAAAGEVVHVSPSRMESFETCALHWLIDQVGGSTSNTAANLGTIIHKVAEESVDHSAEGLYRAVESRWGELSFEAPWQSEVEKLRARDLTSRLSSYLADFEKAGGELLRAEGDFSLPIGPAVLKGSIDRVEAYPNGTAVIVDLKTGKRDASTDAGVADHPQLGAYQLAFASGAIDGLPEGLALGGAKLVIVSRGTRGKDYADPAQAAFSAEQLEEFRQRVVADAEGMADRVFVAQIGTHCLDPWSFGRCRIHVVKAISA
jgi:superfamily I DNA/RNA helicase/RecB family exonuclease